MKAAMRSVFSIILFVSVTGLLAGPKPGSDTKLTKSVDRSFQVASNSHFELVNKYGQVIINTWDKDSIQMNVTITAYGKDYNDAEKLLERVDIDFRQTGQYLTAETLLDRRSGFFKELWNNISDYSKTLLSKTKLEIDYQVYMPATVNLEIENKFGDVYLSEIESKCDINIMHGNLRANRIHKNSSIEVAYGDVKIKELASGRLTLKTVEGDILELGEVQLKSSSSSVYIKKADKIEVDSRSDKNLRFDEINRLTGKGLFSKFEIANLVKSMDMDMNYGEINAAGIPFSFSRIDMDAKNTDIMLKFDPGTYLEVDIQAKEEELSLPGDGTTVSREYTDDKERFVHVRGTIGDKNNYPGYVYINSSGGEVTLEVSGLRHSVNK